MATVRLTKGTYKGLENMTSITDRTMCHPISELYWDYRYIVTDLLDWKMETKTQGRKGVSDDNSHIHEHRTLANGFYDDV